MSKIKIQKKSNKHKSKSNDKKFAKKKVRFSLNEEKDKELEESFNDSSDNDNDLDEVEEEGDEEVMDGSDSDSETFFDHKKSLESLKEKDPEFYEYLQQNDRELLSFDDKESDEDFDDDQDLDEELDETESGHKLTLKQIDEWSDSLNKKADLDTIKLVIKWFRNAVNQTSAESSAQMMSTEMFNAILNVCLIDLLPAIHKYLKLQQISGNQTSNETKMIDPSKSRNWKKVIAIMKSYLTDVLKMLDVVSDSSVKATLMRHILHLIPFFITFPHLAKRLLKQTIVLWSESDEKNRILSFLCILRLMRTQEQAMLSFILKKLYICYVKNCKFTSELSWPLINFMKQSLIELYSLDQSIAYQHAFVFIKQLAINLRTALTVKKKESYKTVYNWQYMHSILFWSQLLCSLNSIEELKPLICPLVNVIIGTIRLVPSAKFFPMRFHLIKTLIKLSEETNTFIPILPLITEVFDHLDNSKKQKSGETKQMNFEILIKVPKLKCSDFEFRNTTINKVYDLILYYLSTQSHRIGFPELVYVSLIKIRKFVKSCHIVQHNQLLKQLLEKIEENCRLINEKRKNITFVISDALAIDSWERELKAEVTPILKFYNQRKKIKSEKEASDKGLPTTDSNLENNDFPNVSLNEHSNETQNKSNSLKRKTIESNVEKNIENNAKKVKPNKKSKKRKRKNTNKTPQTFAVNQALDLSSDECNE